MRDYFGRDRLYPVLRLIPGTIEYKLRRGANSLANGCMVVLPSGSVYTFCVNGSQAETVQKLDELKGNRQPKQRGGMIVASPERVLDKIDFDVLKQVNSVLTPAGIVRFFEISHGGMIVPCKEDVFPPHMTVYREFNGLRFPTVLIVCNKSYKPWQIVERELSRFPEVIWVGSSANFSGEPPLSYKQICSDPRLQGLATVIEDPGVEEHPSKGSYTLVDSITKSVIRMGNIRPETHPSVYKAWDTDVFKGCLRY